MREKDLLLFAFKKETADTSLRSEMTGNGTFILTYPLSRSSKVASMDRERSWSAPSADGLRTPLDTNCFRLCQEKCPARSGSVWPDSGEFTSLRSGVKLPLHQTDPLPPVPPADSLRKMKTRVILSYPPCLCWSGGTGRRSRLKICRRSPGVGVQLPPPAPTL